jgi:hypothetical protein
MSAKLAAQAVKVVLDYSSGSLAANGSKSGSAICNGYAVVRGLLNTDVALTAGSGLILEQSIDRGSTWDYVSASDTQGACSITACETKIYGNAFRVTACNGATAASTFRIFFALYPVT